MSPPRESAPHESALSDELDAEFRRVATVAAGGDLVAARSALRRLADRAVAAGRHAAASRALRLSAALDRVLGDTADAVATARRSVDLAGADPDLAAPALDELGEALLALGHASAAADAFARATTTAPGLATAPALRRKQAYALACAGRADDAAAVLRELAGGAGDPAERAAILVQAAAGAAGTAGAEDLWTAARAAVDDAGDDADAAPALRADLAFVAAARAMDAGDLAGALAQVRLARRHALDGVAALAYIAASIAESALAELAGDDEAAYGSLATGYATLGDLVGRALSVSTFEAPLLALREHWGADRFAAAKAAYEATRRRARDRSRGAGPAQATAKP